MVRLRFESRPSDPGASLVAQTVKCLPAMRETWVRSLVRKIPWGREWRSTPVLLHGKFRGQRSLVGYNPWCRKESDTTERLDFHSPLTQTLCSCASPLMPWWVLPTPSQACLGEGNATPLQYSCLKIPWTEEPGRLQSMWSRRVRHG